MSRPRDRHPATSCGLGRRPAEAAARPLSGEVEEVVDGEGPTLTLRRDRCGRERAHDMEHGHALRRGSSATSPADGALRGQDRAGPRRSQQRESDGRRRRGDHRFGERRHATAPAAHESRRWDVVRPRRVDLRRHRVRPGHRPPPARVGRVPNDDRRVLAQPVDTRSGAAGAAVRRRRAAADARARGRRAGSRPPWSGEPLEDELHVVRVDAQVRLRSSTPLQPGLNRRRSRSTSMLRATAAVSRGFRMRLVVGGPRRSSRVIRRRLRRGPSSAIRTKRPASPWRTVAGSSLLRRGLRSTV